MSGAGLPRVNPQPSVVGFARRGNERLACALFLEDTALFHQATWLLAAVAGGWFLMKGQPALERAACTPFQLQARAGGEVNHALGMLDSRSQHHERDKSTRASSQSG